MNIARAIWGPLLSVVFLWVFLYMISGLQFVFANFPQQQGQFLGDVSAGLSGIPSQNVPVGSPGLQDNTKSAISVESNLGSADKIIFEKDSKARLPIASLTKLMTAVIVLDNYDLAGLITINKDADSQDSMKQDVKLGDTLPVESLLDIMLVESSNKSAYALSQLIGEKKFVSLMNEKALELGMENTFFADPTGLSSQDVSSAADLVKLAEYIIKNYPKISNITRASEFYVPGFGSATNTDQLLVEIPDVVCSKTGFTTAANGCLLLVTDNTKNKDYLINVVLGADDRFSEMKKIINWSSAICN